MGLSDPIKLATNFPKRVLEDPLKTLADLGVGKQEAFNVIVG